MVPERQQDKTWIYPPIGATMVTVVLDEIEVYITRVQNMVAEYIATCPIMDLCLAAEQRRVMRLSRRWWDQPNLNILGIRAGRAAKNMEEATGTY